MPSLLILVRALAVSAVCLLASAQTPTASPQSTTIATTRYTIYRFNLAFNRTSDEPLVSVGMHDVFNDGIGTLKSTAVMFRTPTGNGLKYYPTRCDILFHKVGVQSRTDISDFNLILFDDDDTAEHNPNTQV